MKGVWVIKGSGYNDERQANQQDPGPIRLPPENQAVNDAQRQSRRNKQKKIQKTHLKKQVWVATGGKVHDDQPQGENASSSSSTATATFDLGEQALGQGENVASSSSTALGEQALGQGENVASSSCTATSTFLGERELRLPLINNVYPLSSDYESWRPHRVNAVPGADWLDQATDERKQLELSFYTELELYYVLQGGYPVVPRRDIPEIPADSLALAVNLFHKDCSAVSILDRLMSRNLASSLEKDLAVLQVLDLLRRKHIVEGTAAIRKSNMSEIGPLELQTSNEHAKQILAAYENVALLLSSEDIGQPEEWKILEYKERFVRIKNPYVLFSELRQELGVSGRNKFLDKIQFMLSNRFTDAPIVEFNLLTHTEVKMTEAGIPIERIGVSKSSCYNCHKSHGFPSTHGKLSRTWFAGYTETGTLRNMEKEYAGENREIISKRSRRSFLIPAYTIGSQSFVQDTLVFNTYHKLLTGSQRSTAKYPLTVFRWESYWTWILLVCLSLIIVSTSFDHPHSLHLVDSKP